MNAVSCLLGLVLGILAHVALAGSSSITAACGQYNTTARRDPTRLLNVHLVPHTHDDAGWLKTFDQYFWGTRQDIQAAAVQHVLSTVVQCLQDNPDRRFSYAEMSFFSAWWRRQSPAAQASVRDLVAAGRLDFINGGWVQHDEAAAHYTAMIDQTTRGHRFLNKTFGVTPRVAWQIDPFGHSSTQAALMSAAAGYEALFFGRADYQDMHVRAARKQLELLWRASASWGEHAQVFAHNYPSGNYGPPSGFNYDYGSWDTPIVDDPDSPEYNVPAVVDAFVAAAHLWSAQMVGNDVLFMMGSDFHYANAHAWFVNLDRLIHYVNLDGRVNVLYSTPAQYVEAKASYGNVSWPVKTDDFFPYADCPHCFWTGYFTSRPTSKGYIRQATAYLNAARQLQALVPTNTPRPSTTSTPTEAQQQHHYVPGCQPGSSSDSGSSGGTGSSLDALEAAVSLTQHHDAVSGTEKQAVANDYARQLYLGMQEAAGVVNAALSALLTARQAPTTHAPSSSSSSRHIDLQADSSSSSRRAGVLRLCWMQLQHAMLRVAAALRLPFGAGSGSGHMAPAAAGAVRTVAAPDGLQLVQCPLLNVSVCSVTVAATAGRPQGHPSAARTATAAQPVLSLSPAGTMQQQQQGQKGQDGQQQQQPRHSLRQLKLSPSSSNQQQRMAAVARHAKANPVGQPNLSSTTTTTSSSSSSDSSVHTGQPVVSSMQSDSDPSGVLVVVYNPLAWTRREVVRVAVSPAAPGVTYTIQDADGAAVPSQLLRVSQSTAQLQQELLKSGLLSDPTAAASYELVFAAEMPPVGYATYALLSQHNATTTSSSASATADLLPGSAGGQPTASAAVGTEPIAAEARAPASHTQLSNGVLNLTLHAVTGRLVAVSAADGSWAMSFSQELMLYKSSTGDESNTAAAAGNTARQTAMQGNRSSGSRQGGTTGRQVQQGDCQVRAAAAGRAVRGVEVGCGGGDEGESDGGQSSGAYIFRPAGDSPEAVPLLQPEQPVSVSVVEGPVVTEIHQTWASWVSLTTRLYAGSATLEQEWTVGPIPTADNVGKEVVIRSITELQTGGVLFTDSNGREMLTRRQNHRPSWPLQVTEPVAGNYYPITAAAAVTDGCLMLGVAIDRAQGAASLSDGQLEVMLHRVTIVDDARGVGEPLNETLCGCTGSSCDCLAGGLPARGKHLLVLGPTGTAAAGLRAAQQQLNDALVLAFSDLGSAAQQQRQKGTGAVAGRHTSTAAASIQQQQQQGEGVIAALDLQARWSGVAEAVLTAGGLPPNVHLLTLMRAEECDPSQLILRLAHTFQVDEDPSLSQPVQVDLQQMLGLTVTGMQELSLTAARTKAAQPHPRQWKAGQVISGDDSPGSQARGSSWGPVLWQQLQAHSSCTPAASWGVHEAGPRQQAGRPHSTHWQQQQRKQQQGAVPSRAWNIWDHKTGDSGSVVELFPQEIRTWLVTVQHS